MIKAEEAADRIALRHALLTLEQIAKRSTDRSSRVFAEGAAGDLRARVEATILDGAGPRT